mmetsp:Transcript_31350/g.75841  ORF Transcript_31350/g.75841 Transcript_31350/m.75841 type:complete len:1683 (+) Transcript_31350:315-5363(+)
MKNHQATTTATTKLGDVEISLPPQPSGHIMTTPIGDDTGAAASASTSTSTTTTKMRTPHPSDWGHMKILMHRNLKKDKQKPGLWFAKFLFSPTLWMLYSIGFFIGSIDTGTENAVNVGDYRLYGGETWTFPSTIWLSGFDESYVGNVATTIIESPLSDKITVNTTTTTSTDVYDNVTAFIEACADGGEISVPEDAKNGVCVYLETNSSYTIYYGGSELTTPFQSALSGAQYAINQALLNVSDTTDSFPVGMTQQVPRLLNDQTINLPVSLLIVPGILFVLSVTIGTQFLIGPVVYEKINKVSDSFLMVGVKLRTYLVQWVLYNSLNCIITSAIFTVVTIYWNFAQLSSWALIFFSHWLFFIQLNAFFVLLMQTQVQEESAQGKPWLFALASMAGGAAIIALTSATNVGLYILTIFLPFIAPIQYLAIYTVYDIYGYGTGIHFGDNVGESGLLGVFIAQIIGIMLVFAVTFLYSSDEFNDWLFNRGSHHPTEQGADTFGTGQISDQQQQDSNRFEPLTPGSEVLLTVRNMCHTYMPPRFQMCEKKKPPVEVLKGLDMDICRGEVFGLLGHNGAGKSTGINILTGQIQLQNGDATFHFKDGDEDLSSAKDTRVIRNRIGVCPQHNTSLLEDMTGRENLELIAYLKGGIRQEPGQTIRDAVRVEVQKRLDEISFTTEGDGDKRVDTYSGGMKRKVLIAMALIGSPSVVFLDEPTAGLDPYNRRTIWDMIIAAKRGRSIILTTHFLDEADVLSDRIGILKDGVMTVCGQTLFLKHHFGTGYALEYESAKAIDVKSIVPSAQDVDEDVPSGTSYKWQLAHGEETKFPRLLEVMRQEGATNVSLELTTLEEVFLATGKEDNKDSVNEEDGDKDESDHAPTVDVESPVTNEQLLSNIWEPLSIQTSVGFWKKMKLVTWFMLTNAMKIKESILLNITMPVIYLIVAIVLSKLIDVPAQDELVVNGQIEIIPSTATSSSMEFFGVPTFESNPIIPLIPTNETPLSLDDYFADLPVFGGFYRSNSTLQYAPEASGFSLQVGVGVLTNYSALVDPSGSLGGISTKVQQLPYFYSDPFRFDLLFIPFCLVLGFAGLAFSVLDVLLLKGQKIIELFRVNGITEWTTYLGVVNYKLLSTFFPFMLILIVLGASLGIVLFGNAGRWLGTILMCFGYAFSTSPQGLILAKRFIKSDFKSVANWFPPVYFTGAAIPYIIYSSLLQTLPEAQSTILIVGDVLSIFPQVAFPRGIGALLEISTESNDPDLSWNDVWKFDTRVWYCILMLYVSGVVEWWYLIRLTTRRDPKTRVTEEESYLLKPVDVSHDPLLRRERDRSRADDDGINARDLVKVFSVKNENLKKKVTKAAVKGVSFGVRKNEIFALLGPNGAGKTVTMSMLASQITPDHGDIALDGVVLRNSDKNSDALYDRSNISYCSQFDALFLKKTVDQHLQFYAAVRGLTWTDTSTQDHIDAIVKLLGLQKHREKEADELSGGYKRRLCLALAMIGYPKVMSLDECTTGLDPGARHLVWKVLKPERQNLGYDLPAILLSSHYMDECQELGTRIGIMIDGEIVSTGSLNELYDRYCTSFFVEVSFESSADDSLSEEMIVRAFESADMEASVYESLPFHLKLQIAMNGGGSAHDNTQQLAEIFSLLESKKVDLGIRFYSVARMNLEQIFINLSRKQFEVDEDFQSTRAV